MTSWGVQVHGSGFDNEPKCWRCLDVTVLDDDELGLCDACIALLKGEEPNGDDGSGV